MWYNYDVSHNIPISFGDLKLKGLSTAKGQETLTQRRPTRNWQIINNGLSDQTCSRLPNLTSPNPTGSRHSFDSSTLCQIQIGDQLIASRLRFRSDQLTVWCMPGTFRCPAAHAIDLPPVLLLSWNTKSFPCFYLSCQFYFIVFGIVYLATVGALVITHHINTDHLPWWPT